MLGGCGLGAIEVAVVLVGILQEDRVSMAGDGWDRNETCCEAVGTKKERPMLVSQKSLPFKYT
jgi:hypothetical protein